MSISKERAIQLLGDYLTRNLNFADFIDGWPPGAFNSSYHDPVWSLRLPQDIQQGVGIGGARYIVVSQLTGKIVADQIVGE